MRDLLITLVVVFAVGMAIRYALKKRSAAPPAKANVCPKCGSPVQPDSTFCGNCGTKLE